MCTMIAHKTAVTGSGKGAQGWFPVSQANVGYDHSTYMQSEHALLVRSLDLFEVVVVWKREDSRL